MKTHNWITLKSGQTMAYAYVFDDPVFRALIETYIVQMDWPRNTMTPRALEADQFALPIVQDTIQKTIGTVQRFKDRASRRRREVGPVRAFGESPDLVRS